MTMVRATTVWSTTLVLAALILTACSGILGIGEFSEQENPGAASGDGDPPGEGGAGTGGEAGDSGEDIWIRTFGATGTDTGRALAIDAAGSLYIAGDLAEEVDFGNGAKVGDSKPGGVFVAKLDAEGDWASGSSYSLASEGAYDARVEGLAAAADGDSAVIVGHYRTSPFELGALSFGAPVGSDIFYARLDSSGAPIGGARIAASGEQQALAVAIDPTDGGIVIVGWMEGEVVFDPTNASKTTLTSAGGRDAFAIKIAAAADSVLWVAGFGDDADQVATTVVVDDDGTIFVGGVFAGSIAFEQSHTSASGSDIFLAELDGAGSAARSRSFGAKGASHELQAMALSGAGIVITGSFAGDTAFGTENISSAFAEGSPQRLEDVYVAELTSTLDPLWARAYGGTNSEHGEALAVGEDGSIVVGGSFAEQFLIHDEVLRGQGSGDALVLKLDATGEPLWARGFGRNEYDAALGVAFDDAGDVVIAGLFQQGFKLNEEPVLAVGREDIFLVKLAQ